MDSVTRIIVNVVAFDQAVAGCIVDAVGLTLTAHPIIVDMAVNNCIVASIVSVANENAVIAGIHEFAIANPNMMGSVAVTLRIGDLYDVGSGVEGVKNKAIDDDVFLIGGVETNNPTSNTISRSKRYGLPWIRGNGDWI